MVSQRLAMTMSVERQYASTKGEIEFSALMERYGPPDGDDALAELIEVDGRARLALGKQVDLRRYLDAVPDLPSRPVPLDAAIDVTLRSLSKSSRPTPEAVETLTENYPHLAATIREAATLADAMWSTTGLRSRLESGPRRELPSSFGPRMPSGDRRFELRRLLGAGGWGEVYLALDRQLSEPGHEALVAIKFLTGGDRSPWARQRLIDEATKARRVAHPGVVRVLDRGVADDDEDYIVYEYVEGGDLSNWIKERGAYPGPREAASLMARIARGVHAAHAAGLVHCDLKPGNVLMTPEGLPKVADFGIAIRSSEMLDLRAEANGRPIGNIAFISPEQFRIEEGSLSVASDIYALGGMLYYLLTRRLPNGDSAEKVAQNHDLIEGRRVPPSLREGGYDADPDLDAICARAMAIRPESRHSSAAALADDLEAWLARTPIAWTRPTIAHKTRLWVSRNRVLTGMIAAATLVGGAGVAASVHWSSVAAEKAQLAEEKTKVAKEQSAVAAEQTKQAEQATGLVANLKQGVLNLGRTMKGLERTAANEDLLQFVLVMEWMNGWKTLGVPGFNGGDLRNRVPLARARLQRLQDAGAADSLESITLEGALGTWLLRAGQWKEAELVLRACEDRCARVLGENEPWRWHVSMLRAAAGVARVAAKVQGGSLTEQDREELLADESRIRGAFELAEAVVPDGIIAELGTKALAQLYSPALLDRPDEYAAIKDVLAKRLSNKKKPAP